MSSNDVCNDGMKSWSVVNGKAAHAELLRAALPACQPQEGSPANTFTESELHELQAALPHMNIGPRSENEKSDTKTSHAMDDTKLDICGEWTFPADVNEPTKVKCFAPDCTASPQEAPTLDWHGAPSFNNPSKVALPRQFREEVRAGRFVGPTNGQCPGYLQCNLVVLPAGKEAFDFLLFCQRNPKACPLIEVCEGKNSSWIPTGVAPTADLRTDVPKYAIYRDGQLVEEVTDATELWPEDAVAFLIGCSFSYDGAFLNAGIPLRSAEQGKNVPMFNTNLRCRSAGNLKGNVVVSMKPIPALQVAKEVEITSKYTHAHGGPICIGRPDVIGIEDINKPDYGDPVVMQPDEVPVFHACGVTPQAVLKESKIPFAITHSAGFMFITDLPADMGV